MSATVEVNDCTQLVSETVPVNDQDINNHNGKLNIDKKVENSIKNFANSQEDEFLMSNYCMRLKKASNKSENHQLNGNGNVVKDEHEKPQFYPLKIGISKIGRAELNNICVLSKKVSKNQICIEIDEKQEKFFIWDVGSLNKTFLNGKVLTKDDKQSLEMNDELEFGNLAVKFIFSKMNELERKEQEKNRSYIVDLTNESNATQISNKKLSLFEIQNTLDEKDITSNGKIDVDASDIKPTYYKLCMDDTDVEDTDADNQDQNNDLKDAELSNILEKSTNNNLNNTSGGEDFHLEMSQSILHVTNQSTISNKILHDTIPETIVDNEDDEDDEEKKAALVIDDDAATNDSKPDESKQPETKKVEIEVNNTVNLDTATILVNEDAVKEIQIDNNKIEENVRVVESVNQEKEIKIDLVEKKEEEKLETIQKPPETPIETDKEVEKVESQKEENIRKSINENNIEPIIESKTNSNEECIILNDEDEDIDLVKEKRSDTIPIESEKPSKNPPTNVEDSQPTNMNKEVSSQDSIVVVENQLSANEPSTVINETIPQISESQISSEVKANHVIDEIKPIEEPKPLGKLINRRGRSARSATVVVSSEVKEEVKQQNESEQRPRRSIRASLAPVQVQVQKPVSKRRSIQPASSTNDEATETTKEKHQEEQPIEKSSEASQINEKAEKEAAEKVEENNKEEVKIEETVPQAKKAAPRRGAKKVVEPKENTSDEKDNTEVKGNDESKKEANEVKQSEKPTASNIGRRTSLRVKNPVNTIDIAQINALAAKERLAKKRQNESVTIAPEKEQENEQKEEEKKADENEAESVSKRRKPTAKTKKEEPEVKADLVEKKPPRASRRQTITILPSQVKEANNAVKKQTAASKKKQLQQEEQQQTIAEESTEEEKEVEVASSTKPKRGKRAKSLENKDNDANASVTAHKKSPVKRARKDANTKEESLKRTDTYLYEETDELNASTSKKRRSKKVDDSKQTEQVETLEGRNKEESETADNADKKSKKKRKDAGQKKKLNATQIVEELNQSGSPKLFFQSKQRRKTLPANLQVNSLTTPDKNIPFGSSNSENSKRYSYSSLTHKIENTKSDFNKIKNLTTEALPSHKPSKKFKLQNLKSSSSEESDGNSDESDEDNEPLANLKAKNSNNVSFKLPTDEEKSVEKSKNKKSAAHKRLSLQPASAVISSLQTLTPVANGRANSRVNKSTNVQPKIMATGYVLSEKDKQTINSLGGQIVTDVTQCTHLITNKIRKTCKFLSCLNKGAFILHPKWLDESNRAKTFLNASNYTLQDNHCEKQNKFSLQTSLLKAKSAQLFQDWKFLLIHEDSPQEELSCNDLKTIIECGNGQVIEELPIDENGLAKCCILYSNMTKYKQTDSKYSKNKHVLNMTLDTFLNSILKQSFDIFHNIEDNIEEVAVENAKE